MKKVILFFLVLISFVGLAGCQVGKTPMPTIRGKEVSLNHIRLANFLERITFFEKQEDVLYVVYDETIDMIDEDEVIKHDLKHESYLDLMNGDSWSSIYTKSDVLDRKYEVWLNGFSSSKYLYFSVKQIYDVLDDSFEVEEVFDGKYYIEESFMQDRIIEVGSVVGAEVYSSSASFLYNELFEALIELNRYKYSGLKFYEQENKTTISLKIDLKTYETQRNEIKDVFDDLFGIDDIDKEYKILEFSLEYIGVFERNSFVESGFKLSMKVDIDEGAEHFYYKVNAYSKYGVSLPNEIKYQEYDLIFDIEDIIKY